MNREALRTLFYSFIYFCNLLNVATVYGVTQSETRSLGTKLSNTRGCALARLPPPWTLVLTRYAILATYPVFPLLNSGVEDPGFESSLRRDFFGSSHTSDVKIGTPVVTLLGAWRYRVSAGTGWPGVSIL